jgi:hypothetical protein
MFVRLSQDCTLLSSRTEFRFSIQMASMGPSRTIQTCSFFLTLSERLHKVEKIPSVQSLVATSSRPNICGRKSAREARNTEESPSAYLTGRDGFGIHPHFLVRVPKFADRPHEDVDTGGLAGPAGSQGHHSVSDTLSFEKLNNFQIPRRMVDQIHLLALSKKKKKKSKKSRLRGTIRLRCST